MTDTGIFYGTGAAEGVPSPFCDCPMCNYAREHGGKRMQAVEDQPAAHVSEHGSSDETGKKARPGIVAEAQGALGLCL